MTKTPNGKLRAEIVINSRWGYTEAADAARRELKVAILSDHIRNAVESAPSLNSDNWHVSVPFCGLPATDDCPHLHHVRVIAETDTRRK